MPFVEETPDTHTLIYEKYDDDIVKQLHTYCIENAELDYSKGSYALWVVQNIPDIYINGRKVKDIQIDAFGGVFEAPRLFLDGMSSNPHECFVYEDGYSDIWIYQ